MSLTSSDAVVLVSEEFPLSCFGVVMRGSSFAGLLIMGFGCDEVGD